MEAAVESQIGPDELAFREHISGALFQAGVDSDRWRLLSITWPTALIAISADPRPNSPKEFFFCFQLDGYPAVATAYPIDPRTNQALPAEQLPKGELIGRAFRSDWNEGRALYVPWDRVAIEGHPEWRSQHPSLLWCEEKGVVSYLRHTHDLLNSEDYLGV
jgi:hypothetical protein